MKTKNILGVTVMIFALLGFVSMTNAEVSIDLNGTTNERADVGIKTQAQTTSVDTKMEAKSNVSVQIEGDDYNKSADSNIVSVEHRSSVANVVLKLKELAAKDKKIGAEVSAVAQEQNDSNEKTTEAIKTVEARGGFKTFLVGSDYKNLGTLRSSIVTTSNGIDRLTKAMEATTSASIKTNLDLQIKALQAESVKLDAFITANEGKFSLFGWLAKLLNK